MDRASSPPIRDSRPSKMQERREGVRVGATVKVNTTVTFLFDRSVNEYGSARMVRGSRAASNGSDQRRGTSVAREGPSLVPAREDIRDRSYPPRLHQRRQDQEYLSFATVR